MLFRVYQRCVPRNNHEREWKYLPPLTWLTFSIPPTWFESRSYRITCKRCVSPTENKKGRCFSKRFFSKHCVLFRVYQRCVPRKNQEREMKMYPLLPWLTFLCQKYQGARSNATNVLTCRQFDKRWLRFIRRCAFHSVCWMCVSFFLY